VHERLDGRDAIAGFVRPQPTPPIQWTFFKGADIRDLLVLLLLRDILKEA
jgi:hypothetical protein